MSLPSSSQRAIKQLGILPALACLLYGCFAPLGPVQQAHELGFDDRIVRGDGFYHRVFSNRRSNDELLHVYIEGDGRAWLDDTTVSTDPTPKHAVMLELMGLDPHASVYVGRPCYLGLAHSEECHPGWWTDRRYSARVVQSMGRVIERLAAAGGHDGFVLFGHSGGGTIATLLAARLPETQAVITLAPNLDVAAWARLHGYTPLEGSLDPARIRRFPPDVPQVHWFGARDENVPPTLAPRLERWRENHALRVMEDFDHACCWASIWPAQLAELKILLRDNGSPGRQPAPQRSLQ